MIFLVRYSHSKNLIIFSKIEIIQLVYYLVALLFINNIDLSIQNNSSKLIVKLVQRAQRILHTWYKELKYTGGDLKIAKYS